MNRFGCYQLDLTQPLPPLNYDIQVIISEKIGWLCGFGSSEKGEGQTEKEKIGSSNEALRVDNSMDRM